MGTPNFASPSNASKYFVVLANREETFKECTECGTVHQDWDYKLDNLNECDSCKSTELELKTETVSPESWECDDLIENIGMEIENIGGYAENKYLGHDNSYPLQTLGVLESSKSFGDINLNVRVTATIQSAYYEGATLDYIIQLDTDHDTFDISTGSYYDTDVDDAITEHIFDDHYSDMNKGMLKIQSRNAESWAELQIEALSEQLEAIFERFAEHKLGCTGVFSNGEAIYHNV